MGGPTRIFLSSTYTDLTAYRRAVEGLVQEYGELFVGMEHFGARSRPSLDVCLTEVASCDVVIALVGARYGTLAEDGKSFTHHEVDLARQTGIPVLVFIQDSPMPVSGAEGARRSAFLRWLGQYYTSARFDDSTSLVTQIATALRRFELRSDAPTGGDAWNEIIERADMAAEWDCVSVTAHNVDRLHSVDMIAPDYETRIKDPVVSPGGSGANTTAGLGRMGLRVAATGLVADDADGALLKEALKDDGVTPLFGSTRDVRCPTGTTVAFTDEMGRRSIYVNPGANERFAAAARKAPYRGELRAAMRSSRIIHYSSFTRTPERGLQEGLLAEIPARAILSFTPGALYCKLGLDRLATVMSRANILFLYEQQLNMLIGVDGGSGASGASSLVEKIEALYEWKRRNGHHEPLAVVIKNAMGSSSTVPQQLSGTVGRTHLESNVPTQASIAPGIAVRDSTGAGDASAAGLLWSILRGKSLDHSLDIAYVFARSVSREYGSRPGLPTELQLRARWRAWVASPHPI
jgi:sugar/nucleoside kinase (ribokinase family)